MPSQEDYLDNLLKDMKENGDEPEDEIGLPKDDMGELSLDLDAVSGMTEEEIVNLLAEDETSDADDFLQASDMDLSDEDVLKMLEESDDSDLMEIQELLEKADNDELIDDSEDVSVQEASETASPKGASSAGREMADVKGRDAEPTPEKDSKKSRREQQKAEAAEKKAKKQAAREAAKQAKAAAKKEKEAAKAAGRSAKRSKSSEDAAEQRVSLRDEDLMDMSLLDSILSEAEMPKKEDVLQRSKKEETDFFDIDAETRESEEPFDISGEDFSAKTEGEEENPAQAAAEDDVSQGEEEDGLGLDIDGLFSGEGGEGDSVFSDDMMELDLEEADKLIPERGGSEKDGSREKKPLLSKIKDFLMEEDDDENEDLRLSQENQDILNDLNNQADGRKQKKGGGASKAKKAKPKKDAKPKKPAQPKKPAKPKKEKAPKEAEPGYGKKLSVKKILPVALIGISVGVLLFVFVNAAADYTDKKNARNAYYQGDYETCYQNLFGKKLDETESVMYGKSESILYIRLWMREYEFFEMEGDELQALDSLIQSIDRYPELYEYASRWNAGPEVSAGYAALLNILEDKYGLTESQALEIASQRSDIVYTRMVTAIVEGKALEQWNKPELPPQQDVPEPSTDHSMSDPLPEEEGLGDSTFIEN